MTPRIGECLQMLSMTQMFEMKHLASPDILSSCCCGCFPPSLDSISLNTEEQSPSSDSSPKCSPCSHSTWSHSSNSFHESSPSCWSSNSLFSGSDTITDSSDSRLDIGSKFSWCESSPSYESSLNTAPFTPSSLGRTATDTDSSGTFDCTGTNKAHKLCFITPQEGAKLGPCGSSAFRDPRLARWGLKPVNDYMQEMVDERIAREREVWNAERQSFISPACQLGPSCSPEDGAERCAGHIPPNSLYQDDEDDDQWDCPFICEDGSEPVDGTCPASRRMSAEDHENIEGHAECRIGAGAALCTCTELKFGPTCSESIVEAVPVAARKVSSDDRSCSSTKLDYCTTFASSMIYTSEHLWCQSEGACADAHSLRRGIRINLKLQLIGFWVLASTFGVFVVLAATGSPEVLLQRVLMIVLVAEVGVCGAVWVNVQSLPTIAKRLYFAWCFSEGLPSEIVAQLVMTLEASAHLAYAKTVFSVAGLLTCALHTPCARAAVGRVASNLGSCLPACPCKIRRPIAVQAETPRAEAATHTEHSLLRSVKKLWTIGGYHMGTSVSWGLSLVRRVVTLHHALQFLVATLTISVFYLQTEEYLQNAVAQDMDFAMLLAALTGEPLLAGRACVQLHHALRLNNAVPSVGSGTVAQLFQDV